MPTARVTVTAADTEIVATAAGDRNVAIVVTSGQNPVNLVTDAPATAVNGFPIKGGDQPLHFLLKADETLQGFAPNGSTQVAVIVTDVI